MTRLRTSAPARRRWLVLSASLGGLLAWAQVEPLRGQPHPPGPGAATRRPEDQTASLPARRGRVLGLSLSRAGDADLETLRGRAELRGLDLFGTRVGDA